MRSLTRTKSKSLLTAEKGLKEGDQKVCFVCEKLRYDCEWQPLSKREVCLTCKPAVEAERAKSLVDFERLLLENSIILTEEELKGIRADGLTPARLYIYFALRIEGVDSNPTSINLREFCDRWGLLKEDVIIAILSLTKKGVAQTDMDFISSRIYTHEERIQLMEDSVK